MTIDGSTGTVVATQPVGIRHTTSGLEPSMVYVDGSLWVSRPDYGPGTTCTIDVVDPATAAITRTFPVCARFLTPTTGGEVWAASFVRDVGPRVIVIDSRTGAVTSEVDIGDATAMAAGGDRVWVKAANDALKLVVRRTRGVAGTTDLATYPTLAATADGGAWMSDTSFATPGAWRIAPDARPHAVDLPAPAGSVTATPDGGAWFVSTVDLTARRVDATGGITRTVDLPTRAWWARAMDDGGLIAVTDHGVLHVDG